MDELDTLEEVTHAIENGEAVSQEECEAAGEAIQTVAEAFEDGFAPTIAAFSELTLMMHDSLTTAFQSGDLSSDALRDE